MRGTCRLLKAQRRCYADTATAFARFLQGQPPSLTSLPELDTLTLAVLHASEPPRSGRLVAITIAPPWVIGEVIGKDRDRGVDRERPGSRCRPGRAAPCVTYRLRIVAAGGCGVSVVTGYDSRGLSAAVLGQLADGISFRFRWAPEGIREGDLGFRPAADCMSLAELMELALVKPARIA
jgi:hypothetical protein